MLRHLITAMYGGKIDHEADYALLRDLVNGVFCPEAYDVGHFLVRDDGESGGGGLVVPQGTTADEFGAWVAGLPEREPPVWLGLPQDAEKMLLGGRGGEMLEKVRRVLDLLREGEGE